ncbi:MAG: hypothetical protein NC517_02410 [Firmicutes bacterium]|nr:hypothetical protein [Bacillota bacterium]
MKRGKISNHKKCLTALLLILALAGAGCGNEGLQTEETAHSPQTEAGSKVGTMSYGYFYGEEGIVASSSERFLYSDWEPVDFDYICMDPTCSHQIESCSARAIQDEASYLRDFCLVYGERLIILHSFFQLTVDEVSEMTQDWIIAYQTDVYEADLDGSNRRKMTAFPGSIAYPDDTHAGILVDGKFYFGGPTEERERIELDARGEWQTFEPWTTDAIYCLDLNDYTTETFAATEDQAGDASAYQYKLYEYDGRIYAIISNYQGDSAVWYRIEPETGVCEEILRFDSNAARFQGAIGDTVYYTYDNSWDTLYARDILTEAEEREIMTITDEVVIAIPFVIDGQILFMTNYCLEGDDFMAEYAVLDRDGNVLDRIRYDDYITFLDVIGDKLLYFKNYPDYEVWWVDKDEIINLLEKGVRIGPLSGAKLDTLKD